MIPLDGMADLPAKQKQKLMDKMEAMQASDRHVNALAPALTCGIFELACEGYCCRVTRAA